MEFTPENIAKFTPKDLNLYNHLVTEDIEEPEPIGYFDYGDEQYPYWGKSAGRIHTLDYEVGKFNRYAKFGLIADELLQELISILQINTNQQNGRCAFASLMMMVYGVRIGNEDSAEGYESGLEKNKGQMVQTFGTTTLQNNHISIKDGELQLHFLGKEQVEHYIKITEKLLVQAGKRYYSADKPQQKWIGIDYAMLFSFVKHNIGEQFVPKDLRTFCANITAWREMKKYLAKPVHRLKSEAKKDAAAVIEHVAARLGNTPAIARRNYVDHRMLNWFISQRYRSSDA